MKIDMNILTAACIAFIRKVNNFEHIWNSSLIELTRNLKESDI